MEEKHIQIEKLNIGESYTAYLSPADIAPEDKAGAIRLWRGFCVPFQPLSRLTPGPF